MDLHLHRVHFLIVFVVVVVVSFSQLQLAIRQSAKSRRIAGLNYLIVMMRMTTVEKR